MEINPIRNKEDHHQALSEIEVLMTAEAGSIDADRLDILVTLVEAYERKHFPISMPEPIDAIKFRMDQGALTVRDLEPFIGKANRVYEILNRKRPLSLAMIRRLHVGLRISMECLVQEYALDK